MLSFSTLKDKRYWFLLAVAFSILAAYAVFAPKEALEKPFVAPIAFLCSTTLFWGTYHLWNFVGDRKKNGKTTGSHDS